MVFTQPSELYDPYVGIKLGTPTHSLTEIRKDITNIFTVNVRMTYTNPPKPCSLV